MTFGSRSLSSILLLYLVNLCTDIRGPLVDEIVVKIFFIAIFWVLHKYSQSQLDNRHKQL